MSRCVRAGHHFMSARRCLPLRTCVQSFKSGGLCSVVTRQILHRRTRISSAKSIAFIPPQTAASHLHSYLPLRVCRQKCLSASSELGHIYTLGHPPRHGPARMHTQLPIPVKRRRRDVDEVRRSLAAQQIVQITYGACKPVFRCEVCKVSYKARRTAEQHRCTGPTPALPAQTPLSSRASTGQHPSSSEV